MEKQWQQDERNPEFPFLRKAWRRNISALWDQIWKKLNYKKRPLSSYLAGDEISQNLYDTSHDEMEFPSHMDDVFLYSKQPATIPAVEESIAYPDLDLLSVAAKKKPAKKPALWISCAYTGRNLHDNGHQGIPRILDAGTIVAFLRIIAVIVDIVVV